MAEITVNVPPLSFMYSMHKAQKDVFAAFNNGKRFFLLNWHRRARKSTLGLNLLIREAMKQPNRTYLYIAPTYTQARSIVWLNPNMLAAYLPKEIVKRRNEAELFVEFINGSILSVKGADNPDSIKGVDCEGVVVDEFSLIKREIWEEVLRPIIAQSKTRWAMFPFTPKGNNHAQEYWDRASSGEWGDEWFCSLLKSSQSGIIPAEELEKARREMPTMLYDQEMQCSFIAEESNVLITTAMLDSLKGLNIMYPLTRKVIACDPALGGDECVIYVIENNRIIDEKYLYERDSMKVAGELNILGAKHRINEFVVDVIGIGRGIADRLQEMKCNVRFYNSSETSGYEDRFQNTRAESYWYTMEQIRDKKVIYPYDNELRRQLTNVPFKVVNSNGKVAILPKDQIKKMLGHSPDRADCFTMGIWALKDVAPWKPASKHVKNSYDVFEDTVTHRNPMTA